MKIRPVGVEFFHADGETDRQTETDMTKKQSLFAIFLTRLELQFSAKIKSEKMGTQNCRKSAC